MGVYGTLSINPTTGDYSYEPNDEAIRSLTGNASEEFNISAVDSGNGNLQVIRPLTIMITGVDDEATLSMNLNTAFNTEENEAAVDLGTIIISDVDSDRNLTNLIFSTTYGIVTFLASGTATEDGAYSLSLASNQLFDNLTETVTETIMLTTADGTRLDLELTFKDYDYSLSLDTFTFSYSDTAREDDFIVETGVATAIDSQGSVSYGIVNDEDMVVTSLVGLYGRLTINSTTGEYSYEPDNEVINALLANAIETFTISAIDATTERITETLTIMIDAIDDAASINSDGQFIEQLGNASPFDAIDVGAASKPGFFDIDEDDDLDLFVRSNNFEIKYFRNDEGTFTEQIGSANPFNFLPRDIYSFAFFDLDGDDDLDLITGLNNGDINYVSNDGGIYTHQTGEANPFEGINVGTHSTPTFFDVDGDNDLDLVFGTIVGTINYYRNDDGTFTQQLDSANPFASIDVAERSSPVFFDVDGDNDLDLVIGAESGMISYYRNDGGTFTQQLGSANPFDGIDVGNRTTPIFADVDGDGDDDLASGAGDGTVSYFLFNSPATLSTNLNEAVNTATDEANIDLGTITINDRDNARNLINLMLVTTYGDVTFTASGTATEDGEYTLSLASNDVFDALTTATSEGITLITADGTSLTLTLNFGVDSSLELDTLTFSYSDTVSEDDFLAKSGKATAHGSISYGLVNVSGTVVTSLTGLYGRLTINSTTGEYSYEPNDEAINDLVSNATETFTIEAINTSTGQMTETLTIMISGVDDVATLDASGVMDAINTSENEGDIDLGTITISDVDSNRNLINLVLITAYGDVTFMASGTPAADGEYSLSLASIQTFDNLTETVTETIMLTTADGTRLDLELTFREVNYNLSLDTATFSYIDTAIEDDFMTETGVATASDSQGSVSYGIVADEDMVVTSLVGLYGRLTINSTTGEYSYEPNAEAINDLLANTTETFTIEAIDNRSMGVTQTLTIMLTGVNDDATISTNLNEAVNTAGNEENIDLGTITISDIDSERNLIDLVFTTAYGDVTFMASGTPAEDGAYSLSLASNDVFDALINPANENITLTTADGTEFNIMLTFQVDSYNLTLSNSTFSYSDSEDDSVMQTGTATASDFQGTVSYGLVADDSSVVTSLSGDYGTLIINTSSGAYSYDPDDAAINNLSSNASETFTISVIDGRGFRLTQPLRIMITASDDPATLSMNLNDAINTPAEEGNINLGTVIISDVDSARNLQDLNLLTSYGLVMLVASGIPAADGEYSLSLASNDVFDALVTLEEETITLTTADGTELELTLTFRGTYNLTLSSPTFSYSDSEADPQEQRGTVTVDGSIGPVTYGVVNDSSDVVFTLAGDYGILTVDVNSGAYSYDPDDEAILALTADASEEFNISAIDTGNDNLQLRRPLTISISAIDDAATLNSNLNDAVNTIDNEDVLDLGSITISDRDSARNLVGSVFSTTYGNVTFSPVGTASEDGEYTLSLAFNTDFEDLETNMSEDITLTTADGTELVLTLRFRIPNIFELIEVDEINKEATRTIVNVLVKLGRDNPNQEEVETINNHIEELALNADNNFNAPSVEAALESLVPDNAPTLSSAVESTLNNVTANLTDRSLSVTEIGLVSVKGPQDRSSKVSGKSNFNYTLTFNTGGRDGESNALGYGYNGYTLGIGYDRKFSDVFVGLGLSYSDVSIDNDNHEGSSSISTVLLSAYGNYQKDEQTIHVIFSLGSSGISSLRQGVLSSVSSSSDAFSYDLSAIYAWTFRKHNLKLTPIIGFRYNVSSFDDIIEKGTGATTSSGASYDSFYVTIGGIVSKSLVSSVYHHQFSILGDLSLNLLDVKRDVSSRFNAGSDSFEVSGVDESVVTLNLGFSWRLLVDSLSYELGYKLRFNSISIGSQFTAQIKHSF